MICSLPRCLLRGAIQGRRLRFLVLFHLLGSCVSYSSSSSSSFSGVQ